jgi:hypothetical protein
VFIKINVSKSESVADDVEIDVEMRSKVMLKVVVVVEFVKPTPPDPVLLSRLSFLGLQSQESAHHTTIGRRSFFRWKSAHQPQNLLSLVAQVSLDHNHRGGGANHPTIFRQGFFREKSASRPRHVLVSHPYCSDCIHQ